MPECLSCAAGSYQTDRGSTGCNACRMDSFCPERSAAPSPCKEGTFGNVTSNRAQANPNPNPNPNPNSNPSPSPYLNPNPNPNPSPSPIPIPIPIPIPVPVPSQALLQELVRVSTLDRG